MKFLINLLCHKQYYPIRNRMSLIIHSSRNKLINRWEEMTAMGKALVISKMGEKKAYQVEF